MASTFCIALEDQAVPVNATDTLANIKSIIEIPAPANQGFRITCVDLTFDGTSATAKEALFQLTLASATGTFSSSNLTPCPVNESANVNNTLVTAANIKYGTATAEGTILAGTGGGLRKYRLQPMSGLIYQLPLGRELWVPKGDFFRIRAVVAAAVNVTFNIEWEE